MSSNGKAAGRVVVITGASSGAGRAMAIEFAKEGASLVLAARREEALQEVANECTELGAFTNIMVTDTREADEVQELVQFAMYTHGKIDVWINNAGVLAAGKIEEIPSEVNEAVIRTNLIGYMNGAHAVIPIFKKQDYGILINNISVGGWLPTPYMAAYCASKFGLNGFTQALKGELKDHSHIHVCDLYPPFLDTPGVQHSANFTGKQLTPSPPLYDPRSVAKIAVSLIDRPRSISTGGFFPHFLRLSNRLFPVLTRNITASLITTYLKNAEPTENTSGNVLNTVDYGKGIDGGWRNHLKPKPQTKFLLLTVVAAGLLLLQKK